MSSSTGPPPPTAQRAIIEFPLENGFPLALDEAIKQDPKGRLACAYITVLYADFYEFSYKDIHRILLNKKCIDAKDVFNEKWKGLYLRLPAEAAKIMTEHPDKLDYNAEGLGKFLAQGHEDMGALDFSMYLGVTNTEGNHVEGLDQTVDDSHRAAHLLRTDDGVNRYFGNDVYGAAWNTVYPQSPSIQS